MLKRLETWASGDDGRRLRDVVALSTLPAMWFRADPLRIAENLAAALFATVAPELVYVSLQSEENDEPVATAQVGRSQTNPALAEKLGPALLAWTRNHDPDQLMEVPNPVGEGSLYIATQPIGLGAEWGVIAAGFPDGRLPDGFHHLLLNIAATQAATAVQNMRLLSSLRQSIADREESQANERRARLEIETLQEVSGSLVGELDLEKLVQRMTDAATQLSGASFGAFFYNRTDESNNSYMLYTLSGAPREAFAEFGMPRNTAIFDPTFRGECVVRLDDVLEDPRFGRSAPHYGMPEGHLPVRSYLAVPVLSRSGEVLGGLFLGHPEPGVFTDRAERLVVGIAGQAAIAIDNARLYGQAQEEIAARKRHEQHQKLLLAELNHRVKNTLATVQSIAMQTLKGRASIAEERQAFQARLAALSKVHDLLTEANWHGTGLRDVVLGPLAPYGIGDGGQFIVDGPDVHLKPKAALALGMAFHELATNAAKYGALSNGTGHVKIAWEIESAGHRNRLRLRWSESGGPPVEPPRQRGFGSVMIERGLSHDLGGSVQLLYEPTGVVCAMDIVLP